MTVCPWAKLSDEVLASAILKFYEKAELVPPGIAMSALEGWASKMAFGCRRVTQRFRKLWKESPVGAKSKVVSELKTRLIKVGVEAAEGLQKELSHEDLEEVADGRDTFDWEALRQKLIAKRKEKKELEVAKPAAEKKEQKLLKVAKPEPATEKPEKPDPLATTRPVSTPARAHCLPPFVVQVLAEQSLSCPKPFPTVAVEEELQEPEKKEGQAVKAKKGSAAKAKAKSKPKQKKKSKAKVEVAGPEVEALLQVPEESGAAEKMEREHAKVEGLCQEQPQEQPEKQPSSGTVEVKYSPKVFQQKKKEFVEKCKKEGLQYKQATDKWMLSSERSDLLSTLSMTELKRRRFL